MFHKISPRKISDEIIEQFKALLNRCELKPGDKLPSERELANLIGVSRPSLREALNVLQAMGLLEILPRRKIVVKSIADKSLHDPLGQFIAQDVNKLFELLEIRSSMEGWAAYQAAERATREDIQDLQAIIETDQANLDSNTDDAKTDADFHVTLATATHNTLFSHLTASFYHLLWDTQKISREQIFRHMGNRKKIVQQHMRIFRAIRDRDSQRASEEARKHIQFVESELRRVLGEDRLKT
ncbi:MAG: FadR/GntR family transcriptional regulator [Thermodesulfobacteriota bacterium]